MIKLIIVDDDILVRIGMKSLVDYEALGIEIVGVAGTGKDALELIKSLNPQIAIVDIKMPVMDGLELIECCNRELQNSPHFIVLTSYEEFDYVRRALRVNVVDYLVKLELTADVLTEALQRTIKLVKPAQTYSQEYIGEMLTDRFFNHLLNHVFPDERSIQQKAIEYNLELDAEVYAVAAVKLNLTGFRELDYRDKYGLCSAVRNMIDMTLGKHQFGYVTTYTESILGVIFCCDNDTDIIETCSVALEHINQLSQKYFNVPLLIALSRPIRKRIQLSQAFKVAQKKLDTVQSGEISLCQNEDGVEAKRTLDITEINRTVIKSFENYKIEDFESCIDAVSLHIQDNEISFNEGIDIISSVVHLIINGLNNGYRILNQIFDDPARPYVSIYSCDSKVDLCEYIDSLKTGLAEYYQQQKGDSKNNIVRAAQAYIRDHLHEKITLNDVAQKIQVSPNYLSSIFKTYANCGFSDYVAQQKIRLASQILKEGNLKIYQVSEMLGFDTPYYFSTVYKKYTGISPTEAMSILDETN